MTAPPFLLIPSTDTDILAHILEKIYVIASVFAFLSISDAIDPAIS